MIAKGSEIGTVSWILIQMKTTTPPRAASGCLGVALVSMLPGLSSSPNRPHSSAEIGASQVD